MADRLTARSRRLFFMTTTVAALALSPQSHVKESAALTALPMLKVGSRHAQARSGTAFRFGPAATQRRLQRPPPRLGEYRILDGGAGKPRPPRRHNGTR